VCSSDLHKLQNMRTKTLICAAAIAASALTAVAQNVYSLNIVGYVNVPVPGNYSILVNPLSAGATNGANEIMGMVPGTVFLTYDNGAYTFRGVDSDGVNNFWIDATGGQVPANQPQAPTLPPGRGFWFYNPAPATYTFVGQVVPNPGTTNNFTIKSGYSLIGTPMPVSATLGTAETAGVPPVPGALNMPVMLGENVIKYSNASGSYDFALIDVVGDPPANKWVGADGSTPVAAPTIKIGEGFFFYNPNPDTAWLQCLP